MGQPGILFDGSGVGSAVIVRGCFEGGVVMGLSTDAGVAVRGWKRGVLVDGGGGMLRGLGGVASGR